MGLILSESFLVPADRGPSELDAVHMVESLQHGGPYELHNARVLLVVEARVVATRAHPARVPVSA